MQDMQSVNPPKGQSKPLRAFVDQINDGLATLLLGDDESIRVTVPVAWLPKGVKEGSVLKLGISIDEEGTLSARKHTQDLLNKLGNNP